MDPLEILRQHRDELRDRFYVKEIGVFGSYVRGEAGARSDVDVLVEFEPGQETFNNYFDLQFFLEELFGCKVDLVLRETIKPRLREWILRKAQYV